MREHGHGEHYLGGSLALLPYPAFLQAGGTAHGGRKGWSHGMCKDVLPLLAMAVGDAKVAQEGP